MPVINPALGCAVYFERTRKDGMYVVSPLQLYLDLKGMAVGEEVPKQFLESLICFK